MTLEQVVLTMINDKMLDNGHDPYCRSYMEWW